MGSVIFAILGTREFRTLMSVSTNSHTQQVKKNQTSYLVHCRPTGDGNDDSHYVVSSLRLSDDDRTP